MHPDCQYGYSDQLLREQLTEQEYNRFVLWMRGQTVMLCSGTQYNHDTAEYEWSECGLQTDGAGHGKVYYTHDFNRWCNALPIID